MSELKIEEIKIIDNYDETKRKDYKQKLCRELKEYRQKLCRELMDLTQDDTEFKNCTHSVYTLNTDKLTEIYESFFTDNGDDLLKGRKLSTNIKNYMKKDLNCDIGDCVVFRSEIYTELLTHVKNWMSLNKLEIPEKHNSNPSEKKSINHKLLQKEKNKGNADSHEGQSWLNKFFSFFFPSEKTNELVPIEKECIDEWNEDTPQTPQRFKNNSKP